MRTYFQLLIWIVYLFPIVNYSVNAQNTDKSGIQLSENVDTTWVNHYMSGLLQGEAKFVANTIDALGNVYVTGMIKNLDSGNDYMTIKYNSAGVEQWSVFYNGPGNSYDYANSIAVDIAGNVYVTGGSEGSDTGRDYATIKYNESGQEQWVVRYDGPGSDINFDKAYALVIDSSGNIYITGGSDSRSSGDYATIKYNNDGIEQWVARYDGPDTEGEDSAYYIALDDSGNIYVTGRSDGPGTKDDYATIKYNVNGEEQWVSRYNGPANNNDQPGAIAVDDSGNVYVTGSSVNAQSRWDYLTVKYNAWGIEQWTDRYVGPANSNDNAKGLVVNDSGYIYVTGNSYDGITKDDFTTIKYNPSGAEQWVSRYNSAGNGYDKATVIDIDESGNIYVAGQSAGSAVVKYTPDGNEVWAANYAYIYMIEALSLDASGNIHITGNSTYDCATIKFNTSGIEEWAVTQSGPGLSSEYPVAMVLDPSGNLYVAGVSRRSGTNGDYSLIKYDPAGVEQWVAVYNGPDSSSEGVTAMAIDIAGNIYLTGSSDVYGAGSDWATVKYNSNGVEQWVARFNGPGNSSDIAKDLAVDESGNVFVTGYSTSEISLYNLDFTTVKYNASGIEQWIAYYEGPGQAGDDATAIALDDSGNVFITGTSASVSAERDYATIKYNNEGIEQWVARYNGTGNSTDIAVGIAVDNLRNVVVSGASKGDGTNYDYVTIQYNSAGVEQWVKRYNGTGNGWDWPEAIAVNDTGDVFVSGYGEGTYSDDDFITIKYDRLGNEKWVSKYDGPSYSRDQAKELAIGENGNIYVTGVSTGYYGSYDYATVKINPEGFREWVLRYDFKYDQPVDVVTDGLGHIYVTGYTIFDNDAYSRCTTIKYTDLSPTGIENVTNSLPGFFRLGQNYPNPFNPATKIQFRLPKLSKVKIEVFNILGQRVDILLNRYMSDGLHEIEFNAQNLSGGVYLYRIQADKYQEVKKMILLK